MVEALPARIETLQTDLKESKQQLAVLHPPHPPRKETTAAGLQLKLPDNPF
jgi:hypothetical protein